LLAVLVAESSEQEQGQQELLPVGWSDRELALLELRH
jgi:hypothetical protein